LKSRQNEIQESIKRFGETFDYYLGNLNQSPWVKTILLNGQVLDDTTLEGNKSITEIDFGCFFFLWFLCYVLSPASSSC